MRYMSTLNWILLRLIIRSSWNVRKPFKKSTQPLETRFRPPSYYHTSLEYRTAPEVSNILLNLECQVWQVSLTPKFISDLKKSTRIISNKLINFHRHIKLQTIDKDICSRYHVIMNIKFTCTWMDIPRSDFTVLNTLT